MYVTDCRLIEATTSWLGAIGWCADLRVRSGIKTERERLVRKY